MWTGAYYGTPGYALRGRHGHERADAIAVNDGGITVRPSTGTGFGGAYSWTTSAYYGGRGTYFADVTGEGLAGAIVVNDSGITVRRSNGGVFTGNEAWTASGF